MKRRRLRTALLLVGVVLTLVAATSPWIVQAYWSVRSSNAVRRGLVRAEELGCFSCHGELGGRGIPIPGSEEGVPQWTGGVWMMYVENDEEIRRYIVEGSPDKDHDRSGEQTDHDHDGHPNHDSRLTMPAFGDVLSEGDVSDLVATFMALSGMVSPARGSPARSGFDLARDRRCFSCHGPAGSGGLPNPGSFTGFIPGWYGADFEDLVRDREEFDSWILEGSIPRLSGHPIASYFLGRQKIRMPAYREFTAEQLDALWAYVRWLDETDGGHAGEIAAW